MKAKKKSLGSTIKPVGEMVLVYHDQDQNVTAGGIHLPGISEVKVLTGRIAALPKRMEEDTLQYPFEVADHIIYDIRDRVPVELMPGNRYFLVDAKFIYGVVSSGEEEDDE
jgi:co-chaperonin GroES (HSP10)